MEPARRKRINRYKQFIVISFLALTCIPCFVSIFLLGKVNKLEKEITLIAREHTVEQLELLSGSSLEQEMNEEALSGVLSTDIKDNQEEKQVYLTFDDGPSEQTDEILDILKEHNVKATFFVIGKTDAESKRIYKRIVEEGHTLGMHSYTHDYQKIYASQEAFEQDVTKLSDLLYDTTGIRPKYYRFPGGSSNTVSRVPVKNLIQYLNEEGISYYDWNALNGDAVTKEISCAQLNRNILKDVRRYNVSIVLMHDLVQRHNTVKALPSLIKQLKKEGYELLPISDSTPVIQHVKLK